MQAVIKIGSAQHRVAEGDVIDVNRLHEEKGSKIAIEQVLYFEDGTDIRIGQPFLKDVKVTAEVQKIFRGEKMVAFKFKKRKGYKRKVGHRQELSQLKIVKIVV